MAKFDEISAGHNEALIAMGVIEKPPENNRESPTLPGEMIEIYHHFKRLRFGKSIGSDVITLVPRSQLTYSELSCYSKMLTEPLKPIEVDIIMDLDAIFETREVNNG